MTAPSELESFEIYFDPEPIGMTSSIDLSGNDTLSLWYRGLHDKLIITSVSVVETLRTNPYDFIIADNRAAETPVEYGGSYADTLTPFRKPSNEIASAVNDYAHSVLGESGRESLSFLSQLCSSIHRDFKHTHRALGPPRDPVDTISEREGACRDLSVLFIEAVKALGFAARFVSGYKGDEYTGEERQLHAWVEVYLPGGGWRGYDPTTGLMVSDSHVSLATGVSASDAATVTGSYRGENVTSTLDFKIDITTN